MFLQWNFPLQIVQRLEKVYLSALCWKHTAKIQHCQHCENGSPSTYRRPTSSWTQLLQAGWILFKVPSQNKLLSYLSSIDFTLLYKCWGPI